MTVQESYAIVIGGGTMGLFTALNLAERGRSVTVLERGTVWGEASSVNAGSLGVQNKLLPLVPYAVAAFDVWAGLAKRLGRDVGYHRTGGYKVATSQDEVERLRSGFEAQLEVGLPLQWKSEDELRKEAPWMSEMVTAASYCELDGQASPTRLGPALMTAVRRSKVDIVERVQIGALKTNGSVTVETSRGVFHARNLVISAGGWSGRVAAMLGINLPVSLDVNMVSVTEPAPLTVGKMVTHARGILTVKQVANGSCLIGGGWQGIGSLDDMAKDVDVDQLTHNLVLANHVLPGLERLHILRSWAGYEGVSPDSLPYLGRLPGNDNIYVATCARGGFTLGPLFGQLLAELIVSGTTSMPIDGFNPGRFGNA
jgi:glycine/D-amino acid oxidase-like deaminating enzyme